MFRTVRRRSVLTVGRHYDATYSYGVLRWSRRVGRQRQLPPRHGDDRSKQQHRRDNVHGALESQALEHAPYQVGARCQVVVCLAVLGRGALQPSALPVQCAEDGFAKARRVGKL